MLHTLNLAFSLNDKIIIETMLYLYVIQGNIKTNKKLNLDNS